MTSQEYEFIATRLDRIESKQDQMLTQCPAHTADILNLKQRVDSQEELQGKITTGVVLALIGFVLTIIVNIFSYIVR